jgi:hypothetical protein
MDLKLVKQRKERRILARVNRLKIGRKAKLIVKKEGASQLQPLSMQALSPLQEVAVAQVEHIDNAVEQTRTLNGSVKERR